MLQTILIVGLGRTFVLIKLPTETAGHLFFLKMRAFDMSSAVGAVIELLPTRSTLKLFHRGKHRGVKHLFHQISKYIYKHSGREIRRELYRQYYVDWTDRVLGKRF